MGNIREHVYVRLDLLQVYFMLEREEYLYPSCGFLRRRWTAGSGKASVRPSPLQKSTGGKPILIRLLKVEINVMGNCFLKSKEFMRFVCEKY